MVENGCLTLQELLCGSNQRIVRRDCTVDRASVGVGAVVIVHPLPRREARAAMLVAAVADRKLKPVPLWHLKRVALQPRKQRSAIARRGVKQIRHGHSSQARIVLPRIMVARVLRPVGAEGRDTKRQPL